MSRQVWRREGGLYVSRGRPPRGAELPHGSLLTRVSGAFDGVEPPDPYGNRTPPQPKWHPRLTGLDATGLQVALWEDLYVPGDTLRDVAMKVAGNKLLSLPEGVYELPDYTHGYFSGLRLGSGGAAGCRGIVGAGRSTVIRMKPGQVLDPSRATTRILGDVIQTNRVQGLVFDNFALIGTPQSDAGGSLYGSGIVVGPFCGTAGQPDTGPKLSNLYLRGANPGYSNAPPGETFGINLYQSPHATVSDCEIDGRDEAGNRVSASPLGWNSTIDAKVYRVYAHHGRTSMLTFWETVGVYTEDYWGESTASGSGGQSGCGLNHERASGHIWHERPVLYLRGIWEQPPNNWTTNNGTHIDVNNDQTTVDDLTVNEPWFDRGPGSTGCLSVRVPPIYIGVPNKVVADAPNIIYHGVRLAPSIKPGTGWGDKDPTRYYTRITD